MQDLHAIVALCKLALCALALPSVALSDGQDAALCLEAAETASAEIGVPYEVLLAVSMVETGRGGQPWPWTVNIGGNGHWPDTAEEAENLVESALEQGLTNVDLGCFQLNLYWHAGSFASVQDMLDPQQNASYAAGFLAEKFAETGDWSSAAAAYHSATPEHAETYQVRFDATLASMADSGLDLPLEPTAGVNRYPLLTAGQGGILGSLVPSTAGGLRLIGAP